VGVRARSREAAHAKHETTGTAAARPWFFMMTEERKTFERQIESAMNRYAITTGAVEFLFLVLECPPAQVAVSKVLLKKANAAEWREFARFVDHEGKQVTWWGPVPIAAILPNKETIITDLVGKILTEMIGDVDFYLAQVLLTLYGHSDQTGSSWSHFERVTKISLIDQPNGSFVYKALQERHKVEHNRSIIDQRFLEALEKKGVLHAYEKGNRIERGHFDTVRSYKAFLEFVAAVDELVQRAEGRQ
jgi:hypothetical protein